MKERDYAISNPAGYGAMGKWLNAATSLLTHRPQVHFVVTQGSFSPLDEKHTVAKARRAGWEVAGVCQGHGPSALLTWIVPDVGEK